MSSIMDEWLKDHEDIDELAIDLMHKINQRNQYPTNTSAFAKSDLYIKELFKKFQRKVGQLQDTLNQLTSLNKLTQRENERRQRLVDNLNDRCKKIEQLLQNPADKRSALLNFGQNSNYSSVGTSGGSGSFLNTSAPTVSWNDGLDNNDLESVTKLREQQKNMIKEQDQNMDSLSVIIARQKALAQGIDSELNLHNEILEDIGEAMEDNNERLLRNTRNIRFVSRESGTCGYWMVILLLLVAIVVVSLVPN